MYTVCTASSIHGPIRSCCCSIDDGCACCSQVSSSLRVSASLQRYHTMSASSPPPAKVLKMMSTSSSNSRAPAAPAPTPFSGLASPSSSSRSSNGGSGKISLGSSLKPVNSRKQLEQGSPTTSYGSGQGKKLVIKNERRECCPPLSSKIETVDRRLGPGADYRSPCLHAHGPLSSSSSIIHLVRCTLILIFILARRLCNSRPADPRPRRPRHPVNAARADARVASGAILALRRHRLCQCSDARVRAGARSDAVRQDQDRGRAQGRRKRWRSPRTGHRRRSLVDRGRADMAVLPGEDGGSFHSRLSIGQKHGANVTSSHHSISAAHGPVDLPPSRPDLRAAKCTSPFALVGLHA